MISIPDPLHPAITHFPIAFLIVGALFSLLTLFTQRGNILWFTAVILVIGALGAIASVATGEGAADAAGKIPASAEQQLYEHAEWGEKTRFVAGIAAIIAILAASVTCYPKLAWSISLLTTIAALLAAFSVYKTGHAGATIVYDYGIGVKAPTNNKMHKERGD